MKWVQQIRCNGNHQQECLLYAYKPDDKVLIKYYSVQEVATEKATEPPETVPNITVENNADFAALMAITDQTDATTIQKYRS